MFFDEFLLGRSCCKDNPGGVLVLYAETQADFDHPPEIPLQIGLARLMRLSDNRFRRHLRAQAIKQAVLVLEAPVKRGDADPRLFRHLVHGTSQETVFGNHICRSRNHPLFDIAMVIGADRAFRREPGEQFFLAADAAIKRGARNAASCFELFKREIRANFAEKVDRSLPDLDLHRQYIAFEMTRYEILSYRIISGQFRSRYQSTASAWISAMNGSFPSI